MWFYQGLGVTPMMDASNDAMALILFMFALPVFTFLLSPLTSLSSRKHEFEADAFAARAFKTVRHRDALQLGVAVGSGVGEAQTTVLWLSQRRFLIPCAGD